MMPNVLALPSELTPREFVVAAIPEFIAELEPELNVVADDPLDTEVDDEGSKALP